RDFHVTGVQTCALPILGALGLWLRYLGGERPSLPSPDPEPAATHATPPYDPAAETGAETAPARDPEQERLKDQASRTIESLGYLDRKSVVYGQRGGAGG